jgi:hypothetical protein
VNKEGDVFKPVVWFEKQPLTKRTQSGNRIGMRSVPKLEADLGMSQTLSTQGQRSYASYES